jgi:hypothetical protein
MTGIAVASEMAIVAVCDPSVRLPSNPDQDVLVRELEPMARSGRVFYLITDDPVQYRIGLVAGEQPPSTHDREFEASGGTFGLELPSGRVALHGWSREGIPMLAGAVESAPGPHVLSVLARRPFEASRHAEDMTALLGSEWTYMERVNRLGLVGCVPLVVTAITVLAQKWHWLWFVLPFLAVSWVPYLFLRRSPRYKAGERRAWEEEQARPHFVFSVIPTVQRGLPGGFLRV